MRSARGTTLWSSSCPHSSRVSPTLVRYDAAFLQDEQQLAQVGNLVQGIGAHHDQVGELAGLDRAQLMAHPAELGGVPRGGQESLPGGRAVLHPESQLD